MHETVKDSCVAYNRAFLQRSPNMGDKSEQTEGMMPRYSNRRPSFREREFKTQERGVSVHNRNTLGCSAEERRQIVLDYGRRIGHQFIELFLSECDDFERDRLICELNLKVRDIKGVYGGFKSESARAPSIMQNVAHRPDVFISS